MELSYLEGTSMHGKLSMSHQWDGRSMSIFIKSKFRRFLKLTPKIHSLSKCAPF